jgi:PPK2 family polyphosphate:nucleotide phosphotransferase
MDWKSCKVLPGKTLKLSAIHTGDTGNKPLNKKKAHAKLTADISEISELQNKLYAENRQSLLIILQGMDSSGKDGTIKHIMSGVNPQGVLVHSFKHPSDIELEHDYLWRHTQKLPERGQITIFNRSHYENVLISKVHPEIVLAERLPGIDTVKKIDQNFWDTRYKQINHFEKNIVENGTTILKFFLHLSKDEQRERFLERIRQKAKNWKFSSNDINERHFWNEYQAAYEQALMHTSTKDAPWYVIPADDKSYTHRMISKIILETLRTMNPQFPPVSKTEKDYMKRARKELQNEL